MNIIRVRNRKANGRFAKGYTLYELGDRYKRHNQIRFIAVMIVTVAIAYFAAGI